MDSPFHLGLFIGAMGATCLFHGAHLLRTARSARELWLTVAMLVMQGALLADLLP